MLEAAVDEQQMGGADRNSAAGKVRKVGVFLSD